jgi:hypothetical protein
MSPCGWILIGSSGEEVRRRSLLTVLREVIGKPKAFRTGLWQSHKRIERRGLRLVRLCRRTVR